MGDNFWLLINFGRLGSSVHEMTTVSRGESGGKHVESSHKFNFKFVRD